MSATLCVQLLPCLCVLGPYQLTKRPQKSEVRRTVFVRLALNVDKKSFHVHVCAGVRRCCHHAVAFHSRLADAQNTPANASAAVLAGKELQSLACLELVLLERNFNLQH